MRLITAAYATLFTLLAALWIYYALGLPGAMSYAYPRDFLGPYVGALAVTHGEARHLYQFSVQRGLMDAATAPLQRPLLMPFVFPAYVAVGLSPLGLLSYPAAFLVWTAVNACLAAWMCARLAMEFGRSRQESLAIAATLLASTPLLLTIFQGQLGVAVALGLGESLIALRAERRFRAGLWLALGLLKPQLVLLPLLALLAGRCWPTLKAFALAAGIVLAGSFAVAGAWIGPYLAFLRNYPRMGRAVPISYPTAMQNWLGALVALLHDQGSTLSEVLAGALALATALIVIRVCRSGAKAESSGRHDWHVRFALAALLGVLVCPHVYMHDVVIALPAGVVLYADADNPRHAGQRLGRLLIVLLALEPVVSLWAQLAMGHFPTPVQWMPWYIAASGGLMVYSLLRAEKAGRAVAGPGGAAGTV